MEATVCIYTTLHVTILYGQARMAEGHNLKRAENAEAAVKDLVDKIKGLEVELANLKKQMAHTQESVAKTASFSLLFGFTNEYVFCLVLW
jgi:uncharacterized membrane protein